MIAGHHFGRPGPLARPDAMVDTTTAPRSGGQRHAGRHRRPARTVVGLLSETLGDRVRVVHAVTLAAAVFAGLVALLAVALLLDPNGASQLAGCLGHVRDTHVSIG